jgi:hypothetical protein
MAQSIRNIIAEINTALTGVFKGGIFKGVAILVERDGKSQPVVNEQSVVFDDSYALSGYHRLGDIAITRRSGFGDKEDTVNTFNVSLVVFNNEKITKLATDEIGMIIQSVLALQNISSVRILPARIILNTQSIFTTEYRGHDFPLSEYYTLLQMNYTVEVTFRSGCFDLCPEGFSQCKTS